MSDFKEQLIQLGMKQPDLREHIRPILREDASNPVPIQRTVATRRPTPTRSEMEPLYLAFEYEWATWPQKPLIDPTRAFWDYFEGALKVGIIYPLLALNGALGACVSLYGSYQRYKVVLIQLAILSPFALWFLFMLGCVFFGDYPMCPVP